MADLAERLAELAIEVDREHRTRNKTLELLLRPSYAAAEREELRQMAAEDRATLFGRAVQLRKLAAMAPKDAAALLYRAVVAIGSGENASSLLCEAAAVLRSCGAPAGETKSASRQKTGKRRQSDLRPLTTKQTEAIQIVGECSGDIAKAAKRLGKDRKTVKQHYDAGMAKVGQAAVVDNKPKPGSLPTGSRGDDEVTGDDDRRARIRPVDRK